MADWSNKLGGKTVRLAGLLHFVDAVKACPKSPKPYIEGPTMARAIELMRYFIEHARATFDLIAESDEDHAARKLCDWAVAAGRRRRFSAREARIALKGTAVLSTAEKVDAALAVLVTHGWVRPAPVVTERTGPGRPPSPVYEVNPLWERK